MRLNTILTLVTSLMLYTAQAQTTVSLGYGKTNYKPLEIHGVTAGQANGDIAYVRVLKDKIGATVTLQPNTTITYNGEPYNIKSVGFMANRQIGDDNGFYATANVGINVYGQQPVENAVEGVKSGSFVMPMGGITVGYKVIEATYLPLGNVITLGIKFKL